MSRTVDRFTLAAFLCLAMAACDGSSGKPAKRPEVVEAGVADCAIGLHAKWSPACAVERERDILTLRHGDGGFRRFQIVHDGRGLIVADGAEPATVVPVGKELIELSVGQDRYRLPASIAEGSVL